MALLRPLWLLALPLGAALIMLWNNRALRLWGRHLAPQMLAALRLDGGARAPWLALAAWALVCLALCGPAVRKELPPLASGGDALVIALDLSPSMLAADLQPSRLVRARLKIIDLLRMRRGGQTALIAYAGDAFVVAPLSPDAATLEALVPTLHPNLLPDPGSNTEAAAAMAGQLLANAGVAHGHILLVTDGVAAAARRHLARSLDARHRLSVLAVGTPDGAPIETATGPVQVRLDRNALQILAGRHQGRYAELQADDSDINYLLSRNARERFLARWQARNAAGNPLRQAARDWRDLGPWLLPLLLVLGALLARRGWLLCLPFALALALPPGVARADWDSLWRNADQRAAALLRQGRAADAARLFRDPAWRAQAHFEARQYADAAAIWRDQHGHNAWMNAGKAAMLDGDPLAAIGDFERILAENPANAEARELRDIARRMLPDGPGQQGGGDGQSGAPGEDGGAPEPGDNGASGEDGQQDGQQGQSEGQPGEAGQQGRQGEDGQQDSGSDAQGGADERRDGDDQQSALQEQDGDGDEQGAQAAAQPEAASGQQQLTPTQQAWMEAIPDQPGGLLRRKFAWQKRNRRAILPPPEPDRL